MTEQVHTTASKMIKAMENQLYEEQLRRLQYSVSEDEAEADIAEIYNIMKAIDKVINIPILAVVE